MNVKETIQKELESYCLEPDAVDSIMKKFDAYEIEITTKRDTVRENRVREETFIEAENAIRHTRLRRCK